LTRTYMIILEQRHRSAMAGVHSQHHPQILYRILVMGHWDISAPML